MEHDKGKEPDAPASEEPKAKPAADGSLRDPKGRFVRGGPAPKGAGRPKGSTAEERALRDELLDGLRKAGLVVVPLSPTAGEFWQANVEGLGEHVLALARRHPGLMETLSKSGEAFAYIGIGTFVAGVIYAIAVDFGRASPDGVVPNVLGVTDAYDASHDDEGATYGVEQSDGPAVDLPAPAEQPIARPVVMEPVRATVSR